MSLVLPRWLNLYRRYPYWAKAGCIFVHVPKAAGTSMNHALYGRTLGHYSIEEIRRAFPRLASRSFVFSIVRCPFSRVYSAYRFAKIGRTADMGVLNPEQYRIPEFETFERFVLDWLVYQELEKADPIFRPQSYYLCIDDVMAVDKVIRIEQLAAEIPSLERDLGRKLQVHTKNATGGDRDDAGKFTLDMRNAIVRMYTKDFEVLDYPLSPLGVKVG